MEEVVYLGGAVLVFTVLVLSLREALRLRTFLCDEKEKRLQAQAEKTRLKIDTVLSDFGGEKKDVLAFSAEYNKIKDEEKEIREKLLKEALDKVYAEEQRTQKRLEQEVVQEIIHDVIRNFRHSVYQRVNQPKLKEANAKKKIISKKRISQEREKRNNREQEKLRQEEQKLQEQEKQRQDEEKQRQEEEKRRKDEEKNKKDQLEKEARQEMEKIQKLMEKRGIETPEAAASKAAKTHVSEVEIKPEGISVTKVVSEAGKSAGKVASKASGGR